MPRPVVVTPNSPTTHVPGFQTGNPSSRLGKVRKTKRIDQVTTLNVRGWSDELQLMETKASWDRAWGTRGFNAFGNAVQPPRRRSWR